MSRSDRPHAELLPGRGPPVVLLHGILDGPDAWRPVAARLADAGRAVVLVHSRGHGASPAWAPGLDWSPQAEADEVARLLDGPAHLVGHSRGATSASWIAVERPDLAASLAIVASPPQASEVFRAWFRKATPNDAREAEALRYLAHIPDDAFPREMLRTYRGRALVVEAGDDPLYSPTHTMFWRMFLPYASFERVEGGHRFFAKEPGASWLASRLLAHISRPEG